MHHLFKRERTPVIPIPELLTQFAQALNTVVTERISGINNGPRQSEYNIEANINRLESLLPTSILLLFTTEELIQSRSSIENRIKYAEPDVIKAYYQQFAAITLEERTGCCIGLSSACMVLAQDILSQVQYRHIQVEMCHFANWKHAFIKISHEHDSACLFYDPWFQFWQSNPTNTAYLITESEFQDKMRQITNITIRNGCPAISRIQALAHFSHATQSVDTSKFNINMNRDYRYYVICSTGNFTNPATPIPQPRKANEAAAEPDPDSFCLIL